MSKLRHKSKESAVENVKRLFSNAPEADVISIDDAIRAWGRDITKVQDNKEWLSNKLTDLKYHDLIVPVYTFSSGRRRLAKLQLTLVGKRALGRIGGSESENGSANEGNNRTISDVMRIVAKLRKDNPDYEITFDVRLKGE